MRDEGRKALVPYFMAGATPDWTRHVEAAVLGGADAMEIGIPFSDPMIDGVVIQEAGLRALEPGHDAGVGRPDLASLDSSVPLIAMTYYNIFLHYGLDRSAGRLDEFGFSGAIIPDLALEESGEWKSACDDHDIASDLAGRTVDTADRASRDRTAKRRVRLRLGSHGGDGREQ